MDDATTADRLDSARARRTLAAIMAVATGRAPRMGRPPSPASSPPLGSGARRRALAVSVLAASAVAIGLTVALGAGTAGAQALRIEQPGPLTAEAGNKFCVNLVVDGASDPANLAFAVTDGDALPAGLSFDTYAFGSVSPETRHAIAGIPTAPGSASFEVTVTDDLGDGPGANDRTTTADVTIDVLADSSAADAVIAAGRDQRGYTIDCDSQAREVQGLLRDLDAFGPAGTVERRLAIEDTTPTIDAAYLNGVDVLVDGWVFDPPNVDAFAPAEIAAIAAWVEAGGVLIATEDWLAADALGTFYGAPTSNDIDTCIHTPSEPGDASSGACPTFSAVAPNHPVVSGPFGSWAGTALATSGTVGHFGVDPAGFTVIAQNAAGQATVISRRVAAGRVILLSDEGLLRTESYDGANATFVANLFAYALNAFDAPDLVDDTVAGTTGERLAVDLCANDISTGDPVVDVTISAGTLPIGIELVGCTVRGRPTTPGDSRVTYRVVDGDGDVDTAVVDFTIARGASLPTCRGREATIIGTFGADVLRGTPGDDVIVGRGGDDTIRGRGGDDLICGGGGDDTIFGNAGDDRIFGNAGADRLVGGRGTDVIRGNAGNDTILGRGGADVLAGQRGDDTIRGGAGNDVVRGGPGDDRLAGNGGPRDRCIGGPGADVFLRGCETRRR